MTGTPGQIVRNVGQSFSEGMKEFQEDGSRRWWKVSCGEVWSRKSKIEDGKVKGQAQKRQSPDAEHRSLIASTI